MSEKLKSRKFSYHYNEYYGIYYFSSSEIHCLEGPSVWNEKINILIDNWILKTLKQTWHLSAFFGSEFHHS